MKIDLIKKQEKEEVEIQIKYEGYIKLQEAQVEKFKKWKKNYFQKILIMKEFKRNQLRSKTKTKQI